MPTLLLMGGDSLPFLVEPTTPPARGHPRHPAGVLHGQQHVAMSTASEVFVEHAAGFLA